jgi:hypothetical protein
MTLARFAVLLLPVVFVALLSRNPTFNTAPFTQEAANMAPLTALASPTATSTPVPSGTPSGEQPLSFLLRFPFILADALATIMPPQEKSVTEIPLAGPASEAQAEISGLAWYGDHLIMLPQYPELFASGDEGRLFALPKANIEGFLAGTLEGPLTPQEVRFVASGVTTGITNFEGFEAITFVNNEIFLTIEAGAGDPMMGYLVKGTVAPDLSEIRLDAATLTEIPPAANHSNMSDETLIAAETRLLTIYEVNGAAYNSNPVVHRFDLANRLQSTRPFPAIEYRITDATELDEENQFWALNIYWRGDARWNPIPDVLAARYGQGESHARTQRVERLVEFRVTDEGIELVRQPPIQLQLSFLPRNWEGLARLDNEGFLMVTDEVPRSILGFVPVP